MTQYTLPSGIYHIKNHKRFVILYSNPKVLTVFWHNKTQKERVSTELINHLIRPPSLEYFLLFRYTFVPYVSWASKTAICSRRKFGWFMKWSQLAKKKLFCKQEAVKVAAGGGLKTLTDFLLCHFPLHFSLFKEHSMTSLNVSSSMALKLLSGAET